MQPTKKNTQDQTFTTSGAQAAILHMRTISQSELRLAEAIDAAAAAASPAETSDRVPPSRSAHPQEDAFTPSFEWTERGGASRDEDCR
jgi:hypothetical protein